MCPSAKVATSATSETTSVAAMDATNWRAAAVKRSRNTTKRIAEQQRLAKISERFSVTIRFYMLIRQAFFSHC